MPERRKNKAERGRGKGESENRMVSGERRNNIIEMKKEEIK